jgi:hypothetical protein
MEIGWLQNVDQDITLHTKLQSYPDPIQSLLGLTYL